jgi:hypothetical protein
MAALPLSGPIAGIPFLWKLGLSAASAVMLVLFIGAIIALPPATDHSGFVWLAIFGGMNFVFNVSLAAILSLFLYYVFRRSARVGNATFCFCLAVSIAQVALMSERLNKRVVAELKSRGYPAEEVMARIEERLDSLPIGPSSAQGAQSAAAEARIVAPAKKGEPVVRVYRRP